MRSARRCFYFVVILFGVSPMASAEVHHALDVAFNLDSASIEIRNTVTLPDDAPDSLTFVLHPDFEVRLESGGARLTRLGMIGLQAVPELNQAAAIRPRQYRVDLETGHRRFTLHYSGRIAHALQNRGEDYARSFQETSGIISPQGVFLSAASLWYPQIPGSLIRFDLKVRVPQGWKSMSQGELKAEGGVEHWRASSPQEEIYLIAGPFHAWSSAEREVTAMVLLREQDAALAQKYLDTTHHYIEMYNALIGPYPFSKFAMVENFWETGYGMPSFTLLGSRVIRFPFILHSSFPHEILHNWWGNSVYVDYDNGNWAEGLTSYLADHLIKEQRGEGVDYRRNTLQKYTDYVGRQSDFPLTAFRSRHSARSEAVGYGKTLMLFHMLRLQLGDEAFKQGLQTLYRNQRFKVTGFDDVQQSFARVSDQPLSEFFSQWVERSGAPELSISSARAEPEGRYYRLNAVIEQTQAGPAYRLHLPLAVHLQGAAQAHQKTVELNAKRQTLALKLPARPLRLDVDPEFDVFRRLHRNEIPPAVSQAMGAEQLLLVLPNEAPAGIKAAYRELAESWRGKKPQQIEISDDRAVRVLPQDKAVWLFGWRNRFRDQLNSSLQLYDFESQADAVRIAGTRLTAESHSLAVLGRQTQAPYRALGWLAADTVPALQAMGRKLPHYGRYSYLGFSGPEADNVLKGQWPVTGSPMSVVVEQLDGAPVSGDGARLAPRQALVSVVEKFSSDRMRADIEVLADASMAGRGLGTAALDRAADYIAEQFRAAGLQPGGDNESYFQVWSHPKPDSGDAVRLKNVIAILPGSEPRFAGKNLVIGAHYDHLGHGDSPTKPEDRGLIHPGADDNASGVALLLEMARSLKDKPLPRTLVFIAFTGEESGLLGSRHYVGEGGGGNSPDETFAMLNLDTVGRLHQRPLVIFGTGSADEWVHIFRGAGYVTGVQIQSVSDDFGSGDQTAFIEAGVPAVQLFSGNHDDFHRPGDTADKLDYGGLLKVARVLNEAVRYLGERPEPLSSTLAGGKGRAPTPPSTKRRVSFGTVPDFTYNGEGVRLDDVRAGTPAQQAGLRKGDIITAVNGEAITGMRTYSQALKRLAPGDQIHVSFLRDGTARELTTQVTER